MLFRSNVSITDLQFNRIVNKLVPMPTLATSNQAGVTRAENKQTRLQDLWTTDPRVTPWRNTALGVVQATNTFNHHYLGTDKRRAERNMLNALNGKTMQDDMDVLSIMSEMVGSDVLV